ncbi:MAG: secretion protein HlyD [Alphaproteobacteria bacterium]|nr:secretion protein HlyD [Alphaproteobacteria bacterium]
MKIHFRQVIPLGIVVIAAGAVVYALLQWRHKEQARHELVMHGNIDIRQVDLGFRVAGRIAEMRFEEGDAVKAGDVVAVLDKTPYEDALAGARAQAAQEEQGYAKYRHGNRPQEIEQARAAVRVQEADFANAHLFAQRQKALVDSGSIARQDYDNAVAAEKEALARLQAAQEALRLQTEGFRREDIAASEAGLSAARARLASAETALADTEIQAPADGIMLTRVREPGAVVPAGATVYTLELHHPVWARVYVGEPDLGRLKPGMKADVFTDTEPERGIEGQVGFISPQAEFTPKNIETKELRPDLVYRVRVIVDDEKGTLRQGMPVTVKMHFP